MLLGMTDIESRWRVGFRLLIFVALTSFILLSAVASFGQSDDKVIRVDTELATFEVLVEDKDGKPVRGLGPEEFRIFENGIEKRVDFFQPMRNKAALRPMVVVLAVDVSGSVTPAEIEKLKSEITAFMKSFSDFESYFALVSFAMTVNKLKSFTNKPEEIIKSLSKLSREQDGRSTHAYDGADAAVRLIARSTPKALRNRNPKRAVILITDGFPVGDIVSPATVIERANDAETSIYSVILPSFSPLQREARPLMTLLDASGLVEKTGGTTLYAGEEGLSPLFKTLAEELTASYAIAYYPDKKNAGVEGKRVVRIESKKGYKVKQNRESFELNK